jgi:hypothetical protein
MPADRYLARSEIVGGEVGPSEPKPTNEILVGDLDASGDIKSWVAVRTDAMLIGRRSDPAVVLFGDNLYVIGGHIATALADVQRTQITALGAR